MAITSCGQDFDRVRKCLINGLFMSVAELQSDKKYMMVRFLKKLIDNLISFTSSSILFSHLSLIVYKLFFKVSTRQAVSIHPSSVLSSTLPHCVLFSEVIHTGKTYIRQLTVVDPEWLLEAMPEYFRQHRLSYTDMR